ncbi:hypothetical protein ANPL_03605 [Anaplasma platys]|uniref:BolA family transcriptional regulator n=1 Tax=Anaplasma platys TaxID=949 RepID=A0A858PYY2_9RICK|nr:BolA family protein [Anaplasma platys]QJC27772.1 hypothetical protein ANPL_03605 [Anaplasma platys]
MHSDERSKFAITNNNSAHTSAPDLADKKHVTYTRLAAVIEEKVISHLGEANIKISNESAHHATHLASANYLVSHLKVTVVSSHFDGMSRLNRHKLLNKILEEEFNTVHSIALSLLTPAETLS